MKTRLLIIIGIIIIVAVYLPIHYYYPFLGIGTTTKNFIFCEEGFIQRGNTCHPDPSLMEPNTVLIYPITDNSGTRHMTVPHDITLYLEKDNKITWINKGFFTATVYNPEGTWSTGKIRPSMQKSIQFNKTGFYDYQVDTTNEGLNGGIVAISNETNSLPIDIRMKMGMSIVSGHFDNNPALIGVGIGDMEKGVMITINQEELTRQEDAELFYYNMYKNLIPFEVPITIDFSTPAVPTG
jgi:hypothetical protein